MTVNLVLQVGVVAGEVVEYMQFRKLEENKLFEVMVAVIVLAKLADQRAVQRAIHFLQRGFAGNVRHSFLDCWL